jgi:heptosyltransferase-2
MCFVDHRSNPGKDGPVRLHRSLVDLLKNLDAAVGIPLSRALPRARRPLPTDPHDVLLIRLWGLGNLALLGPILDRASDRRIRLLTLRRNEDHVRSHHPGVEVLTLPEPMHPTFVPALLSVLRSVRRDPPDVIVDCEQFLRLPLLFLRAASGAPTVGLDTPGQRRSGLLDLAIRHDPTRHAADTFSALALAAGLPVASPNWRLCVDPVARRNLRPRLPPGDGPLVVIHPGSGEHFPGRRWPIERFASLANRLGRAGARVVSTGMPSERELCTHVTDAAGPAAVDFCGELGAAELVALLAEADLLVANDTGPVHLASGVGTRSVALYGPNTPHRYGPRLQGSIALFADLPCSPCLDDRSMKRSSCRDYKCMEALGVEAVERACRSVLRSPVRLPLVLSHAVGH